MSLTEIEGELEHLTPGELRHLALRSWGAFVEKEEHTTGLNECDEDDPSLLSALDEAVASADSAEGVYTGAEIRERLGEWTSK